MQSVDNVFYVYLPTYSDWRLARRTTSQPSLLRLCDRYRPTYTQAGFLGGVAAGSVSKGTSYTRDHRHHALWNPWNHSRLVRTSSIHHTSISRSSPYSVSLRTKISSSRMLSPNICPISEATSLRATQYTKRRWTPLALTTPWTHHRRRLH